MGREAKYMENNISDIVELIESKKLKKIDVQEIGPFVKDLEDLLIRAFGIPIPTTEFIAVDTLNDDLKRNGFPYYIQILASENGSKFMLNSIDTRGLDKPAPGGSLLVRFLQIYNLYLCWRKDGFGDMAALETIRFRNVFTVLYDWEYEPFYGDVLHPKDLYDLETINLLLLARQVKYRVWYDKDTGNITTIRLVKL